MSAELVSGVALSAHDVTAGYAGRPVVHDVSVHVLPGEIVSVVGPNGSGKSTFLKSIVGVVEILSGRVVIAGTDVTGQAPEKVVGHGVGYVPQIDDVFSQLTVRENLDMGGFRLPRREVADHVDRVITTFPKLGTMLTRRAGKLSGGERKMLAMARALMTQPRLFVLDEPTANLAPIMAHELLYEHVRTLAGENSAVLIVEQRVREALAISDRTYVLGGGQVRMHGSPAALEEDPAFIDAFLGGQRSGASRRP